LKKFRQQKMEVVAMSPWPAPERDIWRPRSGILPPSELRRALREHPAWTLSGQRLTREWRFTDFAHAFGFVERLAAEVEDFGRRPDICLLDGNRVRVAIANPHRAGVTAAELRLVSRVDAAAERYPAAPSPVPVTTAAQRSVSDSHEHPLRA
jgi:4a-hydroxytetrahydrobiopterin dehydratase